MSDALKRLLEQSVDEVMNCELTILTPEQTMEDAAKMMAKEMISGAPVVDSKGRCIGILAATDFMRQQINLPPRHTATSGAYSRAATSAAYQTNTVGAWMSPTAEAIRATDSLLNAACRMCGSHIHRLVVIDDDNRPVGVVTTLDLVSRMVLALEA